MNQANLPTAKPSSKKPALKAKPTTKKVTPSSKTVKPKAAPSSAKAKPSKPKTVALKAAPVDAVRLGVQFIAHHQLVPSDLNPRKRLEEGTIRELLDSIALHGVMQNLVARPLEGNRFEIVAGERRWRAVELGIEQGRLLEGYVLPVLVEVVDDHTLLTMATAENVQREDLTPLEETEAYVALGTLGDTVADIAAKIGRTSRYVQRRLLLSGLGVEAKDALEHALITLSQAEVLAQVSGETQIELLKRALEHGYSTEQLKKSATAQYASAFRVEHAEFPLERYRGEIVEPLFEELPRVFKDHPQAIALQLEAARQVAETDKDDWAFVEVVSVQGWWQVSSQYVRMAPGDESAEVKLGLVLNVQPMSGTIERWENLRRASSAGETSAPASPEKKPAEISESGHRMAHESRARALRVALMADHKHGVALLCLSLILGFKSPLSLKLGDLIRLEMPEYLERLKDVLEPFGGALTLREADERWDVPVEAVKENAADLLDVLMVQDLETLLDLQAVLMAHLVGNWIPSNARARQDPFNKHLAKCLGVDLQAAFTLDEAYLKTYPTEKLLELAEEAELRPVIEQQGTKKAMVAKFLEFAPDLKARGWLPSLVEFK